MKYDKASFTNEKVNFVLEGEGDLSIILIHGIPSSLTEWDSLSQELLSKNYSVAAVDLLGHGDSLKPTDYKSYTADNAYVFFQNWMKSLQIKTPVVLIGHSFGGYLSVRYALDNPDKVCKLILIDPFLSFEQILGVSRFFLSYPALLALFIRLAPLWFFKLIIRAENLMIKDLRLKSTLPKNKLTRMAADYKRCSPGVVYFPRSVNDKSTKYSELKMPILLIWGNKDTTLSTTWFEKLIDKLPNLTFHVVNAGHYPHQTNNVEVNTYITEFLKSNAAME